MIRDVPSLMFVRTSDQLREVARFRYSVYIDEMGRPQRDADHDQCTIIDRLDQDSFVIGAWVGDRVVGTCRVNFCGRSDIGPYEEWYQAASVAGEHWPASTAILTRLMVAPEYRGSMLSAKLATEAFILGRSRGIECALMDCNEHLLDFFAKIGWIVVGSFQHPDYGAVFTHRFDLRDLAHLERIRSPFVRVLRGIINDDRYLSAKPVSSRMIANIGKSERKRSSRTSGGVGPDWVNDAALGRRWGR